MLKNLVYFGSPEFSAQILDFVIKSQLVHVVGVVTTPDRPFGRRQTITPSPVAILAQQHHLPTYRPEKLDSSNLSHLKLLKPDLFLVVSYGQIMPQDWLNTPQIGTFNLHFSLLPKYRGALPISEAIKNQDKETGVTLMVMDQQLDHGHLIDQQKVPISTTDDMTTLTTKLTQASIQVLNRQLPRICAQNYSQTPQDDTLATYTPSYQTITRANAFIPWKTIRLALGTNNQELSTKTHALIRSLTPKPGAWTTIPTHNCHSGLDPESIQIKIIKTSIHENKLVIDTVQLAGKQPITWSQFLAGRPDLI